MERFIICMDVILGTFKTSFRQFKKGLKIDAIGIAIDLLEGTGYYEFRIWGNEKVYKKSKKDVLEFANKYDSWHYSYSGKKIAVLPLEFFSKQNSLFE